MKKLRSILTGVLLAACLTSVAQDKIPLNEPDYNKPRLFDDLPAKMTLKLPELESLLRRTVGETVKFYASEQLYLEGSVVSRAEENNLLSVVIRSSNKQGATLTFTRTAAPDGSFNYIGRIMSFRNGDAFEIKKEKGQYVFIKKNLYDLIAE